MGNQWLRIFFVLCIFMTGLHGSNCGATEYYWDGEVAAPPMTSRSFTINAATPSDDFLLWRAPAAITITDVYGVLQSGVNVVGGLDECDLLGDNPVSIAADITFDGGLDQDDGNLTNANIDEGNWIKWHTTSANASGYLTVTFDYILDTLSAPLSQFVFTVKTTGPSETFALPLEASGNYTFSVDWGDGTSDGIGTWNEAAVTHTYASAGTHTVAITGTIEGWRFNNGGDKTKIYDIKEWGPLKLGNSNGYFYGCSNLTVSATDVLDMADTTTFSHAFHDCSSLTTLDVSAWDTAAVTNFFAIFCGCSSLTALAIDSWDITAANTFSRAFRGCSSLTTLAIDNWNTAAVSNFSYAFHGCSSLTTLAIDNWDITSVTTMENMLVGVTLTTANYSDIIVAFEAQAVLSNMLLHGGNSKYSAGAAATAHAALIADHSWTITDQGQE